MPDIRTLAPGDEAALERLLSRGADAAMLLRSNALAAGLVDRGRFQEATYVGAFEGDRLLAVAAHCWNGMLLLHAPVLSAELATLAVSQTGRVVRGLHGIWAEVAAARAALGLSDARPITESRDLFYSANLGELIVPESARASGLICRPSWDQDLELLAEWRAGFWVEALHATDSPSLRITAHREMTEAHRAGVVRVLSIGGRPLSCFNFVARVPGALMIGNVWTPAAERGKGYARLAIALALAAEQAHGIERAVLFTETGFHSARKAYESIGFRVVGEYGFVVFSPPGA